MLGIFKRKTTTTNGSAERWRSFTPEGVAFGRSETALPKGGVGAKSFDNPAVNGFLVQMGTVQRSGGSSRLRQLWAWRGDWIEHTTEPGAEHAVVDRAADLKKQIGASLRPSHLLRFIHSPVYQEIRGAFGNCCPYAQTRTAPFVVIHEPATL